MPRVFDKANWFIHVHLQASGRPSSSTDEVEESAIFEDENRQPSDVYHAGLKRNAPDSSVERNQKILKPA